MDEPSIVADDDETVEVVLELDKEQAEKLYWGGGQSLRTSILMRLRDYEYLNNQMGQSVSSEVQGQD